MDVKTAAAIVHHVEFANLKKLDKKDIEPISYEGKVMVDKETIDAIKDALPHGRVYTKKDLGLEK